MAFGQADSRAAASTFDVDECTVDNQGTTMNRVSLAALIPTLSSAILCAQAPAPTNASGNPLRTPAGAPIVHSAVPATLTPTAAARSRLAAPAATPGGTPRSSAHRELADAVFLEFGDGIGASGLHVSVANGVTEVVLGTAASGFARGNAYWFILRHDPASGGLN